MNEPASPHDFWNNKGGKKAANRDFWDKMFECMDQMKPSVDYILCRKGFKEQRYPDKISPYLFFPLVFYILSKSHNPEIKPNTTLLLLQKFQSFEQREKSTDIVSR